MGKRIFCLLDRFYMLSRGERSQVCCWGGGACFAGRQVPCCVSFIDRVTRGQPFHFFPGRIHRLIFVALLAAGKTSHLTSAATNSCDASSQRGQLGRLFVSVKAAAAVDVAVAHSSVESATNEGNNTQKSRC